MNNILDTIFTNTSTTENINLSCFLICVFSALLLGFFLTLAYTYKAFRSSESFLVTLTVLPSVIAVIIMMVNGNLGAGIAVAGAFSLIRFRSVPGTAKEIVAVFIAMGIGFITGMGYITYAAIFTAIMCLFLILSEFVFSKSGKKTRLSRTMRVTIPENLDYTDVFDDIFEKYTDSHELTTVKSVNMGSMFRLTYNLKLKDAGEEKNLLDSIRCRNGNLEVMISNQATEAATSVL